jgi:predicted NUDIX family phosphoesterase
MSEANNVHPDEAGLETDVPVVSKKDQAKKANILGFFRDAADAAFPVQGYEAMSDPTRDVLRERMEALKPGTLLAQRARLEADPHFRHPIPYILIHRQRPDGSLELFVYQRTKLIGEDLLGQKFSVALGGHPEAESVRFHSDWSFNTTESLLACMVTELDEEATFNGMSFTEYAESGNLYTYGHEAFIRDDTDAVGLQHIGVVMSIGLPEGVEVLCKEEELITVGFRTLEELDADLELPEENALYDFENWSKLCIRAQIEIIDAAKAAAAVDAMFVGEHGHDEAAPEAEGSAEEPVRMRGECPELIHIDEAPFLAEGDIGRGLTEPVMQFTVPEDVEGMSRGTDGVLYFTVDAEDPDPQGTIDRLTEIYKETIKPAPSFDAFAQAIIDQIDSIPTQLPVDPSAETKVLTELHREVGTTDDQMKVAVEELVRISDSVQPTAEEEAVRLSDLAS